MTKHTHFLAILFMLVCTAINYAKAQTIGEESPFPIWDRSISESSTRKELTNMIELPNGDLILGSRTGPISFRKYYELMKTDPRGNVIWSKVLGGDTTAFLNRVVLLNDGGFLLVGNTGFLRNKPYLIDNGDSWVVRTDSEGNTLWSKTIPSINLTEDINDAGVLSDGNIILVGSTSFPEVREQYWIIKIDPQGNILWEKTLGGDREDSAKKLIVLPNDELLIAGLSSSDISGDKSENNKGRNDFWVIKTDANANKIWDITLGTRSEEIFGDIISMPDGGFVIGSYTGADISGDKSEKRIGSFDYWVIKIDDQGKKVWDKTIGGNESDKLSKLLALPDGGVLLGGGSTSGKSGNKSEPRRSTLKHLDDYWIVKLDNQGKFIWDKTLGANNGDYLKDMLITQNEGLLLGGWTQSLASHDKLDQLKGYNDIWLLNLEKNLQNLNTTVSLIDANTQKVIQELKDGDIFSIEDMGTDFLSIIFDSKGRDFGSVQFQLEGPINILKTENLDPFSLTGKNAQSEFVGRNFPPGDYKLSITPYSSNKLKGIKENTIEINFSIQQSSSPVENLIPTISLISGFTQQNLTEIKAGDIINVEDLQTDLFTLVADGGIGDFGSVQFQLEGPVEFQAIENEFPFVIFGRNRTGQFKAEDFLPGDYKLTVTLFSHDDTQGIQGTTTEIPFTIEGIVPPHVVRFVLVNADTEEDIQEIKEGNLIDLDFLDSPKLSIRAEVEGYNTGSVALELTSNTGLSHNQTENLSPYALFGGEPSTNYFGKKFPAGDYTIKATSYLESSLNGASAIPLVLNFSVKDDFISKAVLLNAATGEDIGTITEGETYNCLPEASIRVDAEPEVESIQFVFMSPTDTFTRVENFKPYTLLGENYLGQIIPFKTSLGDYQVTINAYSMDNAQGDLMETKTLNFKVNEPLLGEAVTIIDAASGEEIGSLVDDMEIKNPPAEGISFRLNRACIDEAWFQLREHVNFTLKTIITHRENIPPYTLLGETNEGKFKAWKPSSGRYRLRVATYQNGTLLDNYELKFTISIDNANLETSDILLYPNPNTVGNVHIDLDTPKQEQVQIDLMDKQGSTLISTVTQSSSINLDVSKLKPGYYIVRIQNSQGVIRKTLIVD